MHRFTYALIMLLHLNASAVGSLEKFKGVYTTSYECANGKTPKPTGRQDEQYTFYADGHWALTYKKAKCSGVFEGQFEQTSEGTIRYKQTGGCGACERSGATDWIAQEFKLSEGQMTVSGPAVEGVRCDKGDRYKSVYTRISSEVSSLAQLRDRYCEPMKVDRTNLEFGTTRRLAEQLNYSKIDSRLQEFFKFESSMARRYGMQLRVSDDQFLATHDSIRWTVTIVGRTDDKYSICASASIGKELAENAYELTLKGQVYESVPDPTKDCGKIVHAQYVRDGYCSKKIVDDFRAGRFKQLYDSKKYFAAAAEFKHFLDDNDCHWLAYKPYDGPAPSKNSKKSFLWAQSDIILAYAKAGDYGSCIGNAERFLNQYYSNPLKEVEDKKLTTAFEQNLKLCRQRRLDGLSALEKPDKCKLNLINPTRKLISKDALVAVPGTNRCVGIAEIDDELSESEKDNTNSPSVYKIPIVATLDGTKTVIQELYAIATPCGEPEMQFFKDAKGRLVVVTKNPYGFCGGTGTGSQEGLFRIEDTGITTIDDFSYGFH